MLSLVFLIACRSPASTPEELYTILYPHRCELNANPAHFQLQDLGLDWDEQPEGKRSDYWGWGLAIEDFNQDGFFDVFLPHPLHPDQLFFGREAGLEDVSFLLHGETRLAHGASALDLDDDGDIDIVVGAEGGSFIYRNDGERQGFHLLSASEFGGSESTENLIFGFAIGDADQDGLFDMFGPSFYAQYIEDESASDLENSLLWGYDQLLWERQSKGWAASLEQTPAHTGGWLDADDDGDLDLFVVNDKPQLGYLSGLLLNKGDRNFQHLTERGLDFSLEGMGLAWGDLNLDGKVDIGVTGWGNFGLAIGEGVGYWYEDSQNWGLLSHEEHVVGWGIEFADLDNDGAEDVLVANGPAYESDGTEAPSPEGILLSNTAEQYFGVYLNQGSQLEFQEAGHWRIPTAGSYRGFALLDFNQDGFLDVFARDLGRKAKYFQSNCTENKALMIRLMQDAPNISAIGARIWVVDSSGKEQLRDIQAGSTNIGSSAPPIAHFGLGREETVDVRIRWPDQTEQELIGIETGQTILIRKL